MKLSKIFLPTSPNYYLIYHNLYNVNCIKYFCKIIAFYSKKYHVNIYMKFLLLEDLVIHIILILNPSISYSINLHNHN